MISFKQIKELIVGKNKKKKQWWQVKAKVGDDKTKLNGDGKNKGVIVKYVKPKPFYPGVPRGDSFNLSLPDNLYVFFLNSLTVDYPKESAGFGQVDGGEVAWAWWDKEAKGNGGGVVSSQGRGLVAAIQAGKRINMQWHTHPSMSTFWSVTDQTDQESIMNGIIKNEPSGEFTFLVFNHKNFRLRRFFWENYEVSLIQEGFATSNGILLNNGEVTRYKKVGKDGKEEELILTDDDLDDDWLDYTGGFGLYGELWGGEDDLTWWDLHNQPMMGQVKDPEFYRPLFEAAGVTFERWYTLEAKLERMGKGMYRLMLDNPDLWEFVIDEVER
jgi:hypothetical protein